MQQMVQKRCDYDRVMEEFRPVGKRLVRGDDGAGLLIAIGDEPEKQVALLSVYRGVPDLINYNQGRFMVTSAPARAAGIPVFFQLLDKIFHVCKINTHSGLAGLQRKRYRQMRLAHTRRPEKDHISLLLDKGQIKKRHDLLSVQFGLKGKIKLVNTFDKGKPGYFK